MSDDDWPSAILRHAGIPDGDSLTARHGWSNRAWIGDEVVVRVSSGRLDRSLAHEAAVCTRLHDDGFAVARPIAVGDVADVADIADATGGAAGEWLVSERRPGETLADAWPDLGPDQRRAAGRDLGRFLRTLHADAHLDLAPPWWTAAHEPSGYHNAYRPKVAMAPPMIEAARDLPFADGGLLDEVAALVDERLPHFADEDAPATVFTHGDVHGHNLLLDPTTGGLTAVLDWEGAHPATPELELDMLLRWIAAADKFPARPGGPTGITEGDVLELATHVGDAYPELFGIPHLRARLEVYEAQWQLVQLFFDDYWLGLGHGDPSQPSASWDRLRDLVAGRHHLARFDLTA